jgi:hypothetical protein
MANRRFIDFPIAASVGNDDIVLIWQDGLNKQTTKATLFAGSPNSLAGLTDVDISALANGQILQYNSTTSKWENVDRTDIDLDQLGDVTIVSPTNGQVLVYNSSTSKWENSSAGFVPYTGAVTTVNLGAQSILAGSFVKAGGTSAQFLKADGSVDSTAYGTGSVTSVALTMPTAFSVANSPVTTAGTLAVTGAGTTAQYIRGDGSLATFPALTGFVPYTGATADVNLGTHDLTAERGTFQNNGSSDTLTVNHTSGSGYGIIVTKGGNNEALYVSKTSGSGNAMTVVGGRTSLVDLALSSVTNTAGDFLTLSGGVVHKRTAAEVRTDIGAGTVTSVAALTLGTIGTDLSSTVANGTTTPVITLNVPTASATNRGALSSADWSTFNSKQNALTLTTTGTSGAATLVGSTLNIPQYQAAGTYVTGVTASSPLASSGGTTPNITIQQASGSQNGFLSSTDWTTFNNKQNALTNPVTGTGTTNYLPKFTGSTTIGNSQIFDNGTNVGIGTNNPTAQMSGTVGLSIVNGSNAALGLSNGTNNWLNYLQGTTYRIWNNTSTEVMVFHLNGNIGIGTLVTDSGDRLNVNGVIRGVMPNDPLSGTITAKFLSFSPSPFGLVFRGYDTGVHSIQSQREANNAQLFGLSLQPLGGNVLIGTTTDAGFKLDVSGAIRSSDEIYINNGKYLRLQRSSGGLYIQTLGIESGTDNVRLVTTGDFNIVNGSLANLMTIKNGGNVGIGVSPSTRLEVTSGSSGSTEVQRWSYNNADVAYSLRLKQDVSSGLVKHVFDLVNNSTTYANNLVLTNGNVGIRQISPLAPLHVGSASSDDDANVQRWDYAGSTAYQLILKQTVTSGVVRWNFSQINNNTAFNNVLVLDRGNVGIGTATPGQKLTLINGTFQIGGASTFSDNIEIGRVGSDNNMAFATGGTERMRIQSNGNILFKGQSTTSLAEGLFQNTNSALNFFATNTTSFSKDIGFFTNTTTGEERMRITSGGNVLIGTTTNGVRLVNSGATLATSPTLGSSTVGANAILSANGLYGLYTGVASAGHVWQQVQRNDGGGATYPLVLQPSGSNVVIGTITDSGDRLRVNGTTFSNDIMTWNPANDNRSGVAWRLGAASIGTDIPNRRLRVNVGGVEYYIAAVEV